MKRISWTVFFMCLLGLVMACSSGPGEDDLKSSVKEEILDVLPPMLEPEPEDLVIESVEPQDDLNEGEPVMSRVIGETEGNRIDSVARFRFFQQDGEWKADLIEDKIGQQFARDNFL